MNVYPTESREEDLQIAKTIIEQFGRNNLMYFGASSIKAIKAGVQFKVGRNSNQVFAVVIRLMADDTYEVTFFRKQNRGEDINIVNDVYCDQLAKMVGEHLGYKMTALVWELNTTYTWRTGRLLNPICRG